MMVSLAWRNLSRNRRRSILAGAAVSFGVLLISWIHGVNEGAYGQMIDQAVETKLGHLQVMPRGYLDDQQPETFIPNAQKLVTELGELEGVHAASPRVLSEGLLARDNETSPVNLVGVNPELEKQASNVPNSVLKGERALTWCQDKMADALEVLGNNEALFDRWCKAAQKGEFLPEDQPRAIVLGSGVAELLMVSVGDEVTTQVVRAVSESDQDGEEQGSLSQRRLVVTGIVRTGNMEIDGSVAYVHSDTLANMLGTSGPNEIVLIIDDIRSLEEMRTRAQGVADRYENVMVHTWYERNPGLASLIEMDSGNNSITYFVLCLMVFLGVINATLMSVLERTREFGVMLALGIRRVQMFWLIMLEVGLLGIVSVGVGAILGGALEIFGRYYGWHMEWFGYSEENFERLSAAGVQYETVYYSYISPEAGATILISVYLMFLASGLWPAIKASRLKIIRAMRDK